MLTFASTWMFVTAVMQVDSLQYIYGIKNPLILDPCLIEMKLCFKNSRPLPCILPLPWTLPLQWWDDERCDDDWWKYARSDDVSHLPVSTERQDFPYRIDQLWESNTKDFIILTLPSECNLAADVESWTVSLQFVWTKRNNFNIYLGIIQLIAHWTYYCCHDSASSVKTIGVIMSLKKIEEETMNSRRLTGVKQFLLTLASMWITEGSARQWIMSL